MYGELNTGQLYQIEHGFSRFNNVGYDIIYPNKQLKQVKINMVTRYFFLFLMILFLKSLSIANAEENTISNKLEHPIIGILVPLPEESLLLQKNIIRKKFVSVAGIKYIIGTINNKNVVFVNSGLGKINSAVIAPYPDQVRDMVQQIINVYDRKTVDLDYHD